MPRAPRRVEVRVEVLPSWQFALRGGSMNGLVRRRGPGLQRLLHRDGGPVHVAVVQPAPDRVLFAARAASEPDAMWGVRRLRFATGVDVDPRPFHDAHRFDPIIGPAMRLHPTLRVRRTALPWEALLAAICEQLIDFEAAVAIQRRLIAAFGRRCSETGLRDAPEPATLAALAPARLAFFDLSPPRALTLRRAAIEVAAGRADLLADDPVPAWRRLRSLPGIGPWTLEMLALHGQGHHDRVPAGDLGYLKLVGRLLTGHPRARAEEGEVREFFAPYGAWKGLAGEYLRLAASFGMLSPGGPGRAPGRAGTRSSSRASPAAAA
jgi:DNA-3-methyladenine glycosylase II